MRVVDKRTRVSRRVFLRNTAAAVPAAAVAAAGIAITPEAGWAQNAKSMEPAELVTLARMARDIYPHDHLADIHYVNAVIGYDSKAGQDATFRKLLQDGIAQLNGAARKKHGQPYVSVGWETERVALLHGIQSGKFFRTIQGDLLLTLYNNKEVWPKFGYEGSSVEKGGYLERGFDDINWLPTV